MESLRYLEGVSTLKFDEDLCIGCSLCTQVCPRQVFEMDNGKARITDLDACMECGACVNNCPVNALSVNPGVG
jgi:NAD-dependent dihydropyrimidine dehydrogenase PreA subunit